MTRLQPVRAYWRRIPDKDSAVHRDLSDAWLRDLFRNHKLLEDRLARSLEPVLAVFVGEER